MGQFMPLYTVGQLVGVSTEVKKLFTKKWLKFGTPNRFLLIVEPEPVLSRIVSYCCVLEYVGRQRCSHRIVVYYWSQSRHRFGVCKATYTASAAAETHLCNLSQSK